jgi:hypothetical protein
VRCPKWARLESNQRPLPYQRSALPPELHARRLRDKDSNLGLHVQSVASFPLDDPGTARGRPPTKELLPALALALPLGEALEPRPAQPGGVAAADVDDVAVAPKRRSSVSLDMTPSFLAAGDWLREAGPADPASPSTSGEEVDAAARSLCEHPISWLIRLQAERCFLSHSPTLRPWIAARRMRTAGQTSSYVEEPRSPTLACLLAKWQAKANA